jgi:hypothetical protein
MGFGEPRPITISHSPQVITMEQQIPSYSPDILLAEEAAMLKSLEEEHAKNQAVLDQVRQLVTAPVFEQIKEALYDSDSTSTHDYLIADAPLGVPQDEDWYLLGDVFVDQTTNGGMSGDEFAGTMSLPLPDGRFFQFYYVC